MREEGVQGIRALEGGREGGKEGRREGKICGQV
jgi:hypothetical protein